MVALVSIGALCASPTLRSCGFWRIYSESSKVLYYGLGTTMVLVGTPRQMLYAFAFLISCTQWKWSLWVSTHQDFGRVCSVVQHPDSSVCLPFSTYQDFGRVCSVAQNPDSSVCLPFSTYQYFGRGCSVVWYLQYYWEWEIIISVLSLGKVHKQGSESSGTM
jgi:hypothetical protein